MARLARTSRKSAALWVAALGLLVPAGSTASAASTSAPDQAAASVTCKSFGGLVANPLASPSSAVRPAILQTPTLGLPYRDGGLVRANGSVSVVSSGSCGTQVRFQLQSRVCTKPGCTWVALTNGSSQYFWGTGGSSQVSQQVGIGCRPGVNSYRIRMVVAGRSQIGRVNAAGMIVSLGSAADSLVKDGPVARLSC